MKANELMIGDWVEMNSGPVQIEDISIAGYCSYRFGKANIGANVKNLMPIPLTPEILEKNGFDGEYKWSYRYNKPEEDFALTYISYWKGRLSIRVSPDIREKHSTNVMHINCDYVHQLQHALRLCGIEKTIEL